MDINTLLTGPSNLFENNAFEKNQWLKEVINRRQSYKDIMQLERWPLENYKMLGCKKL